MTNKHLLLGLILLIATILPHCVSAPERWPSYERTAEDRMALLQKRIGNGLVSGELTPNEAQVFLARLDGIRGDYMALRDRVTTREEWERLLKRLDVLDAELNKTVAHPTRLDEIRIEDRIIAIQRRIDEGRITRRLNRIEWRESQARLDAIRSEYLQITKVRALTPEERSEITRRLEVLERDINKF